MLMVFFSDSLDCCVCFQFPYLPVDIPSFALLSSPLPLFFAISSAAHFQCQTAAVAWSSFPSQLHPSIPSLFFPISRFLYPSSFSSRLGLVYLVLIFLLHSSIQHSAFLPSPPSSLYSHFSVSRTAYVTSFRHPFHFHFLQFRFISSAISHNWSSYVSSLAVHFNVVPSPLVRCWFSTSFSLALCPSCHFCIVFISLIQQSVSTWNSSLLPACLPRRECLPRQTPSTTPSTRNSFDSSAISQTSFLKVSLSSRSYAPSL